LSNCTSAEFPGVDPVAPLRSPELSAPAPTTSPPIAVTTTITTTAQMTVTTV
jgi:hypothetical protein